MLKPPYPQKKRKSLVTHNDERIDWYFWLRDDQRKNKDVLNYLKKENAYSEKWYEENNVNSKKNLSKL